MKPLNFGESARGRANLCIGSLEERFEGFDRQDAQGFVQVRAVEIQAESRVYSFDVGKALKVGIVGVRMV